MEQSQLTSEILKAFETTLKRYADRWAAPESALQYPAKDIQQALLEDAGSQNLTSGRLEFIKTALVELETFVPDEDANVVRIYQDWAREPSSHYLADADRQRAELILDRIRYAQATVIGKIRGDTLLVGIDTALQDKPVAIGKARRSLDAVSAHKEYQAASFLALFTYTIVSAIAVIGWGLPTDKWESWVYIAIWLLSGALGYFPALLGRLIERVTREGSLLRMLGELLALVLVLGLPPTVAILAYVFLRIRIVVASALASLVLGSVLVGLVGGLTKWLRQMLRGLAAPSLVRDRPSTASMTAAGGVQSRFFRASAIHGRLRIDDVPDTGPWDAARIVYIDEPGIDQIHPGVLGNQKIRTGKQLNLALELSQATASSIAMYIHEGLLSEIKTRWERERDIGQPESSFPQSTDSKIGAQVDI